MNFQLLLALFLFLFERFECAQYPKKKLSYIKWSERQQSNKVAPSFTENDYAFMTDTGPTNQGCTMNNAEPIEQRRSLFSGLFGGKSKSSAKISPVVTHNSELAGKQSNSKKVGPDILQQYPIKNLASVAPLNSFNTDITEIARTESTSSNDTKNSDDNFESGVNVQESGANKLKNELSIKTVKISELPIQKLSEEDVDLLYNDCHKFLDKNKFLFFRFALVKIKGKLSEDKALILLEKATELKCADCVEVLFEHFSDLSTLPTKVIYTAITKCKYRLLSAIINNRTVDDQNLRGAYGMKPYEFAAMTNCYKAINLMMKRWSDTKMTWLPKALNVAISFQAYESLIVIIGNLTVKGEKLDSIFDGYTLLGFMVRILESKDLKMLKPFVKALSKDFLIRFDYSKDEIGDSGSDPIKMAISLDFVEGLEHLVNHFGAGILNNKYKSGYSTFLLASHFLSPKIANYIASVSENLVHSVDEMGNNALHIALKNPSNSVEFIRAISNYGIDLTKDNLQGESASDLLLQNKYIKQKDIDQIFKNFI